MLEENLEFDVVARLKKLVGDSKKVEFLIEPEGSGAVLTTIRDGRCLDVSFSDTGLWEIEYLLPTEEEDSEYKYQSVGTWTDEDGRRLFGLIEQFISSTLE